MTMRPGLPGRSVAPTMARERGFTRGSSCMRGPASEEQGEEHADEDRSGQKSRDNGDDRICFGKVEGSRPAMKIATTASLNECRKANRAPTRIPGRSTGSVTQKKVRSGP